MKTALLFLSFLLIAFAALAQEQEVFTAKGAAIEGYDPVAYFTDSEAKKGEKNHSFEWKGATWHFASAEHLALFKAEPEKYTPQFGGYCAYAVANGYTAKVDPKAWKIVEGKLYLNYNKSVQEKWEANQAAFIKSGHENWPNVLEK